MRASHFALLAAIPCLTALALSAPLSAGGLSDLVGYGAQDVYLDPPAGSSETPAANPAETPAATGSDQKDPAKPTAGKTAKQKQVRLSKACRKAGLKTREDCDAYLARAKEPAKTVPEETTAKTLPAETTPAETTTASGTAGTATGETNPPAATATSEPPAATSGSAGATPVTVVPMASQSGGQPSSNSAISTANQGGSTGLPSAGTGTGSSPLGVLVQ